MEASKTEHPLKFRDQFKIHLLKKDKQQGTATT